jgi:hypothetical protein
MFVPGVGGGVGLNAWGGALYRKSVQVSLCRNPVGKNAVWDQTPCFSLYLIYTSDLLFSLLGKNVGGWVSAFLHSWFLWSQPAVQISYIGASSDWHQAPSGVYFFLCTLRLLPHRMDQCSAFHCTDYILLTRLYITYTCQERRLILLVKNALWGGLSTFLLSCKHFCYYMPVTSANFCKHFC